MQQTLWSVYSAGALQQSGLKFFHTPAELKINLRMIRHEENLTPVLNGYILISINISIEIICLDCFFYIVSYSK